MRLVKGQVFSIATEKGFGFIQYIETDCLGIEYVRVLQPMKGTDTITQKEVNLKQRWCCGFLVEIAHKRELINSVRIFSLPLKYKVEYWTRSPHNVRDKHLGWHIVHRETLKRKFKSKLKRRHLKLSPHGIFNDTLIKEYLDSDWKLSEYTAWD